MSQICGLLHDITIPKVSDGEPLKAECDLFLECIRNGRSPLTSGREATDVVWVLEAIQRSAHNTFREEKVES